MRKKLRFSKSEFLPKDQWGDGPWQNEPDKIEFEHAGLPCILNRGPVTGAWCGYVAVAPGHPLYKVGCGGCFKGCRKAPRSYVSRKSIAKAMRQGKTLEVNLLKASRKMYRTGYYKRHTERRCDADYRKKHSPDSILDVHGGLTYSGECSGEICHVPKPGQPEKVWWFGFDCAHAGDVSPAMNAAMARIRDMVPGMPEMGGLFGGEYKTVQYVEDETKSLAEQLASMR